MAEHNDFGRHCEHLAAEFLSARGYRILDTNWRCNHLELDIVASIGNTLVVAEVRSRNADSPVAPEATVTPRKIRNIVLASQAYVFANDIDMDVRFDIITLSYDSPTGRYTISHIPDAFLPPLNL